MERRRRIRGNAAGIKPRGCRIARVPIRQVQLGSDTGAERLIEQNGP